METEGHMDGSPRTQPLTYQRGKPAPGVTTYGTWTPFTWDNQGQVQHGLDLQPDHAPWRDVFQALDQAPAQEDREVDVREEAAAILAACWRYGSYVHVLAEGEAYPPFRDDPDLSRIQDDEMMRIQVEFSSEVAQWLLDRDRNPELIRRRVLSARHLLPGVPIANIGPYSLEEGGDRYVHLLKERLRLLSKRRDGDAPLSPEAGARLEANWLVNAFYRNGILECPLEDFHAGDWSLGREVPGYKRLYAGDLARILRPLTRSLTFYLAARTSLPLPELQGVLELMGPQNWSASLETAPVRFLGMPAYGPLTGRLAELAMKNPVIYGT